MLQMIKQVEAAMALLEKAGYEAFLVGGCVRDCLMGVSPKDYDLATDAIPQQVMRVFAPYRVIETGLSHGTVTVLFDELPLEITTYRIEGTYSDARHPDRVSFTRSLQEDLSRRDFTMNAMAFHPEKGLQDPFGGRVDIENRVIRCVGEPDLRFGEDALRILRALRFSSVLGFAIAPATEDALHRNRQGLGHISAERMAQELDRLLCGPDAGRVLLGYADVLGEVIPELLPMQGFQQKNRHHCYDVLTHTAVALEHTPPDRVLRWATLLHDIGKPSTFTQDAQGVGHFYGHNKVSAAMADQVLRRLKLDRVSRERIVALVRVHDVPIAGERRAVRRWLSRLTPPAFFDLIQLKRADNWGQAPEYHNRQDHYDRLEAMARTILSEQDCFALKDLAVKGNDLLAKGYQGRALGQRLQFLLDAVLDGRVENKKAALLEYEEKNRGMKE